MGTYKLSYTGQEVNSILGTAKTLSAKVADLEGALDSLPDGSPIAGIVYPFAGEVVPEGFLICDGEAYSRAEYAELFDAIGTTYGEGDGSTTFNVPDLQTRVPVGAGVDYELGEVGGEAEHSHKYAMRSVHYYGTVASSDSDPSDGLALWDYESNSWVFGNVESVNGGTNTTNSKVANGTQKTSAYVNNTQASTSGTSNMQPYTVVNYIISTGKSADAHPMAISETTVQSSAVAGMVYPFAGEGDPEGYLLCDGSEYSRTEYAKLFDAIGTIYGSGDGSTTFNVPNLESRVIIGESDGYALGETGGEEKHTLTVDEMPEDYASFTVRTVWGANAIVDSTGANVTNVSGDYSYLTVDSVNAGDAKKYSFTGEGEPHNNMQPYVVMRYFISTGEGGVVSGGNSGAVEGGIIPADYIIEQGSDDMWTWRKYASGVAECWGIIQHNITGFGSWGGGYVSNEPTTPVSYPFEFAEIPTEVVNISDAGSRAALFIGKEWDKANTTTTCGSYLFYRGAEAAAMTVDLSFHVKGTWKELSSGGTASGAVYGINPADYVVEWGQTDGWYWEKYASGKAECWAVLFEENNEPYSTWNNMPFRYTPMWEFPIEFIDVPSVSYAGYIGSGYAIDARAEATKDWVRLFFATSATGSEQVEAHIQAKGFWKDSPASGGTAVGHFDNATVDGALTVDTINSDGGVEIHHNNGFKVFGEDGRAYIEAPFGTGQYSSIGFGNYENGTDLKLFGNQVVLTSTAAGLNNRALGVNKVLWSGEMYMNESQVVTLSEAVSAQPSGIVLVWSYYNGSNAVDDRFSFFFVPKQHVITYSKTRFQCGVMSPWNIMAKVVYVSDTQLTGDTVNVGSQTNDPVTWNGNNYCLRYVIGV